MNKKECPLCENVVDEEEYVYHHQMEDLLLNVIGKNHPK